MTEYVYCCRCKKKMRLPDFSKGESLGKFNYHHVIWNDKVKEMCDKCYEWKMKQDPLNPLYDKYGQNKMNGHGNLL